MLNEAQDHSLFEAAEEGAQDDRDKSLDILVKFASIEEREVQQGAVMNGERDEG